MAGHIPGLEIHISASGGAPPPPQQPPAPPFPPEDGGDQRTPPEGLARADMKRLLFVRHLVATGRLNND